MRRNLLTTIASAALALGCQRDARLEPDCTPSGVHEVLLWDGLRNSKKCPEIAEVDRKVCQGRVYGSSEHIEALLKNVPSPLCRTVIENAVDKYQQKASKEEAGSR